MLWGCCFPGVVCSQRSSHSHQPWITITLHYDNTKSSTVLIPVPVLEASRHVSFARQVHNNGVEVVIGDDEHHE